MKKPFIEISEENFTLLQFDIKPPKGYEVPVSSQTGKELPNCCQYHKDIFDQCTEWFEEFPNCCEPHKKLKGKWWFNKANYNSIVTKIICQISYTEYQIKESLKKPDWYEEITDYIEYNVISFGHPAVGLHHYLGSVRHYIRERKNDNGDFLSDDQRTKINFFIDKYYTARRADYPNLDVLYKTYQEWLKIFPFDLNTYFGNLKKQFYKSFPILVGNPVTNRYTGLSKSKVHTKESLIDSLTQTTNNLLTQVNSVTLHEKGLITDFDKLKLELIISSRKQKLKDGYTYNSPDEQTRIKKMIHYWFKDEKKFIDEISPLLKGKTTSKPQANEVGFAQIFNEPSWQKYVEALMHCQPPLLDKKFTFIGDKSKHRGVIAAWFKFLKQKAIIKSDTNREKLAKVLSSNLKNFTISGSSVDNKSKVYEDDFEDQLTKLTGIN